MSRGVYRMDFGSTRRPQVGDTVWLREPDAAGVILRIELAGTAYAATTLRCRCRRGDLVYRADAWACPACGWYATDEELRDYVRALAGGWCTVPGCRRRHHARGLCTRCYDAWRRRLPERRAAKRRNWRRWQAIPEVRERRNAAARDAYADGCRQTGHLHRAPRGNAA